MSAIQDLHISIIFPPMAQCKKLKNEAVAIDAKSHLYPLPIITLVKADRSTFVEK